MAKTRSWFRNGFLILALLSVALIVPVVCFAAESEISLLDESQTEYKLTYDSGEFAVSSTGTLQLHIIQTADGEDISDRVIWLSSAPNIAAIDKNGLVSGKKVGEAEISCLSLDGKTTFVKASIKVVAGVESAALSDSKLTLLLGAGNEKAAAALSYTVQPENAYFQGATWISSDESVAIVDASGKVNAVGAGTCLISVISEDSGFSTPVSCEITVLQAVSQISISAEDILWTGSTQKIAPVISPEDASVQNVLWESSDPSVATVDASGNVRGLTVGTATIKCISTDGSGVFGECAVRVEAKTQSIDFIEKTVSLLIGAGEDHSTMVLTLSTTPADAYYQTATWTSSDENVVTVDAQGRLRAVSEGCAQITAVSDDPDCKTAAKCNVVVSKAVQSIVLDEVEQTAYTAATVKLHADVGPDDAANKKVDFSVSWGTAPTHGSEPVENYLTVTPDSDGSTTATVSCKNAFGDDTILITVTTREGGYTATCTVTFTGVADGISISGSTATKKSSSGRGEYYEVGTSKTYTFNISLTNAFDDVASDLSVKEIGGVGTMYFGNGSFNDGGYINYTEMYQKDLGEVAGKFITSATISGNTLTVKTGSVVLENYYDHIAPDEYYIVDILYDRYVVEITDDTMGYKDVGDSFVNQNAKYNAEHIDDCYFYVTVEDEISGLTQTVKLWLVSSVSGVSLSPSALEF